jgi:hypothetical protein
VTRLSRFLLIAFALVAAGMPMPARAQDGLPEGWASTDVGAVAATGNVVVENGTFTVAGAGADVWGSADEFHYAYTPLTGDGSIVAQLAGIQNVNAWTKAGVMMRESLAANARHAFMLSSPGKGHAFQRRASTGGASSHTSGGTGTAPVYVKLTRVGDVVTASRSVDGTTWTTVGSDTIAMGATIYVGVAVSSHVDGVLAAASFAQVTVSSLPHGWSSSDIGAVGARGGAGFADGHFTVSGAGADVWGAADELHYAYKQVTGERSCS